MNSDGHDVEYETHNNTVTSAVTYNYGIPIEYNTPGIQALYLNYNYLSGDLTSFQNYIDNVFETYTYDNSDRLLSSQVTSGYHPAMSYSYEDNGNLLTKDDVGTFSYDSHKINAVRHVTNTSNNVSSNEQNIAYTSFLEPSKITENGYELNYTYGPDYLRKYSELKVNGTVIDTKSYSGTYEEHHDSLGDFQKIHYIYGNNGLVSMIVVDNSGTNEYYVYTDQIGSILKVTDATGAVVAAQNFDAWGRNRNPTDLSYSNIPAVPSWLYRGYTGHEHLPNFNLINMNGRLYDPLLGRMLSPDNTVQSPYSTQSYNKYSYVLNNPLKYNDPSGWNGSVPMSGLQTYLNDAETSGTGWYPGSSNGYSPSEGDGGVDYFDPNANSTDMTNADFPDQSATLIVTNYNPDQTCSTTTCQLGELSTNVNNSSNSIFDFRYPNFDKIIDDGQDNASLGGTNRPGVDYYNFNLGIPIVNPTTASFVGWNVSISWDKYGDVFFSPFGINVGKSAEGVSGSFTINKINQDTQPSREDMYNFLSGHSFSFDIGDSGGFGGTWSPWSGGTTTSWHIGVYTPQVGISYNYTPSFLIFDTGFGWNWNK
jgi:RHS repeat-associated protein